MAAAARIQRFGAAVRLRTRISQDSWRRATEWPVTACAALFLAVYAWSVLSDAHGAAARTADEITWAIWIVFLIDYVVSLCLAPRRGHWFLTHLPQFLVVALPALRPLRLLRLLSLISVLQRAAGSVVRGRVVLYAGGTSLLIVFIASLAELHAERGHPGATITTFPNALWWAFETVTTVGYGDEVPTTPQGRLIAIGLMIAGVALLGVVTATLASWMLERVEMGDRVEARLTSERLDRLSEQVAVLSAQLQAAGLLDPAEGAGRAPSLDRVPRPADARIRRH